MNRLFLLLLVSELLLLGCDKGDGSHETHMVEQCPPLPERDGYLTVKALDGGLTLKLPAYANIRRDPRRGCQFATLVTIDYLWIDGRLVSESGNRFKEPGNKRIPVHLSLRDGSLVGVPNAPEAWRYEPVIRHKHFPLMYYPRFHWASESGPKSEHQMSGSWGIADTKYRPLPGNRLFTASCTIEIVSGNQIGALLEGEFVKNSDSKCRGRILTEKQNKALAALIDVWAPGAPEINHIYDAAVEQLQSFIQE